MVKLRAPGGECVDADGQMRTNPETKAPWKHTELMSLLGARWGAMSEAEKAPYKELEAAELARHEKEMAEYKEHGYYTKPDGTKSNASKKSADADEDEEEEEVAKPVNKKQSKARAAKNKKKEETSELSLKQVSANKEESKLLFGDEDS